MLHKRSFWRHHGAGLVVDAIYQQTRQAESACASASGVVALAAVEPEPLKFVLSFLA